jgi:hypothetical protein
MPAWFPAKILTFKRASCGINYLVYGTFYLFVEMESGGYRMKSFDLITAIPDQNI